MNLRIQRNLESSQQLLLTLILLSRFRIVSFRMYRDETAFICQKKAKQGGTVVELAKDGELRIFKRSKQYYIINQ
jgi:hypothetical protein